MTRRMLSSLTSTMALIVFLGVAVEGAVVTGTVTDTEGQAVVGVVVKFTDESDPNRVFSGVTDSQGGYEVIIAQPTAVESEAVQDGVPSNFELLQNYPNPFNPSTVIPYRLKEAVHVHLTIYDMLGQPVRTLVDQHQGVGQHQVVWDGLDDQGIALGAGVYVCRMDAGGYRQVQKMVMLDGSVIGSPRREQAAKPISAPAQGEERRLYTASITGPDILSLTRTGILMVEDLSLDWVVARVQSQKEEAISASTGRSVEVEGGGALIIPQEALPADATVIVSVSDEVPPDLVLVDYKRASKVYDFSIEDADFQQSVGLVIPYDPARLPAGSREEDLFAAWWDGVHWMMKSGIVDTDANEILVETDHLSIWSAFWGKSPEVVGLTVEPQAYYDIASGEDLPDLTVRVAVDPQGRDLRDYDVELYFLLTSEMLQVISGHLSDTIVPLVLDDNGGMGREVTVEHPFTIGDYVVGANLSRYTRDLGVAFDPSGLIFQYGFPNKEEIRWASYAS